MGLAVAFSFNGCGGGGGGASGSDTTEPESQEVAQAQLAQIDDAGSPNARLLFSEDFTGGQVQVGWTSAIFETQNYSDTAQFTQIAGRWAAVYNLIARSDNGNEQTPFNITKFDFTDWAGTPEVDELYIEHYEYWEPGFDFPTGAQKMVRIGRYYDGDPTGPYIDFWNQFANTNLQSFSYNRISGTEAGLELSANSLRGVPTGRWVKFANWVKLNTPGKADGFVRAYVDDQRLPSIENAVMRNDSKGYNFFWIGGNATYFQPEDSGGHLPYPARDSLRYISGIRIYTTRP